MNRTERFLSIVCRHAPLYYVLLLLLTVLAVLNAIVMLVGDQSTGAFVVSVMVFTILGVTGGGVAVLLWICNRQ